MDTQTLALATVAVFFIALVFSMLGLGGAMLYVPVFKWLELPLKTLAIPLGLLLNGATSFSAFLRYWRERLVDFRGGLPAAASAFVMAPVGAWCMGYLDGKLLLFLFAAFTALAGVYSFKTGRQEAREAPSRQRRLLRGTIYERLLFSIRLRGTPPQAPLPRLWRGVCGSCRAHHPPPHPGAVAMDSVGHPLLLLRAAELRGRLFRR
jgi:uncharacterized membrane protein YfcA